MPAAFKSCWGFTLLTALSLSIGWGIRGNFGHEFGAMIPGALSAMAAVLLLGRDDWHRRIHYFGMFGALGWSFGGSISYMQVIAYTHSGHSFSVLYGFACLFVIGFLWAAMGGAGTALPACLDREGLTEFFAPLTAVFVAWFLQDFAEHWLITLNPQFRQASPLYWYDTDWLSALTALAAVFVLALIRKRFDSASSLMAHMAAGWWAGFLLLVLCFGWRMTPPRGDNWAGCIGMVLGLWIWLRRHGLYQVQAVSLISGFIGGLGFATATMLKLVELKSGVQTNWHSILEQSYGLINGVGIASAMLWLARRSSEVRETPSLRRWTEPYAVGFILLAITWLNLSKNPAVWIAAKSVPPSLGGWSPQIWFNLAYLVLATAVMLTLIRHLRQPLLLLPKTWLGRGQLLYLIFLWWMIVGNFERALVSFSPQRLVTEGVLFFNAAVCTLLISLCKPLCSAIASKTTEDFRKWTNRFAFVGISCAVLAITADWAIVRAIYGNQFAGNAGLHIRFGPNATATKQKPAANQPHP